MEWFSKEMEGEWEKKAGIRSEADIDELVWEVRAEMKRRAVIKDDDSDFD